MRALFSAMALGALGVALLPSCTLTLPFDELARTDLGPIPKLHFKLDETSGATAADARGSKTIASIATPNGKDWKPARRGNGVATEEDNFLTIESLGGSKFPKVATFAFWTKVDSLTRRDEEGELEDADLLVALEFISDEDQRFPLTVYEDADTISFRRAFPGDDDGGADTRFPNPGLGKWVLIVVGWDLGKSRTTFYVRADGTPGKQVTAQTGELPPGFQIGKPSLYFGATGGLIDDLKYWDRVLTNEEIQKLD